LSVVENPSARQQDSLLVPLLITLAIALFLMTLMPTTMFWDRDEGFYARAAVEMMRSGHWIVPTYNDAVFAEKPPLIYWLMAGTMRLFGENDFGARFISAPATALSSLFIFLIGNRLFGRAAGIWAMLAFASSTLVIYLGATAMMDAVLITFICMSLWAYLAILQSPRYFLLKVFAFGVGIGLSMLTKGPVGPAVVIPVVAISWLLLKPGARPSFARMLVLAVAALCGLGIFLLWAIPANTMSGGAMMSSGFGVHVLGRALKPMEGHGGSGLWGYLATVPVYIPVILIGFMPATLFLPSALSALMRKGGMEPLPRLFLLSWIIPGFLLFSLAATKLPHYIVPIFPALALAMGAVIAGKAGTKAASAATGRWLYLVMAGSMAIALIGGAVFAPGLQLKLVLVVLGFATAAFGYRISKDFGAGLYARSMSTALISVLVIMETLFVLIIPPLEPEIKISRPIADAIQKNFKFGTPVYSAGYLEPSLVFYLGWPVTQPIHRLAEDDAALKALLDNKDEKILIAVQKNFDALKAVDTTSRVTKVFETSAWNTNSGGDYQTVIVARIAAQP
jgi:4-amino-4-deoxy-L-arabinose transferase-like glycosyltransferase